jgi:hypothetical protein
VRERKSSWHLPASFFAPDKPLEPFCNTFCFGVPEINAFSESSSVFLFRNRIANKSDRRYLKSLAIKRPLPPISYRRHFRQLLRLSPEMDTASERRRLIDVATPRKL